MRIVLAVAFAFLLFETRVDGEDREIPRPSNVDEKARYDAATDKLQARRRVQTSDAADRQAEEVNFNISVLTKTIERLTAENKSLKAELDKRPPAIEPVVIIASPTTRPVEKIAEYRDGEVTVTVTRFDTGIDPVMRKHWQHQQELDEKLLHIVPRSWQDYSELLNPPTDRGKKIGQATFLSISLTNHSDRKILKYTSTFRSRAAAKPLSLYSLCDDVGNQMSCHQWVRHSEEAPVKGENSNAYDSEVDFPPKSWISDVQVFEMPPPNVKFFKLKIDRRIVTFNSEILLSKDVEFEIPVEKLRPFDVNR